MTSPAAKRLATSEPALCGVCRRRATGLGYAPKAGEPIMWLCGNVACHQAAPGVYRANPATLDEYELGASLEAGDAAGRYLDGISKTDLAVLSGDEWRELLRTIITNYESALRRKLLDHEAPF